MNEEAAFTWQDIIVPGTVNLIIGQKGKGKSALAYYLLESIAAKHELLPLIVNFPREKQALLPDNYAVKDLEEALVTENAMILVDEGTTQLPAGARIEELVKACSSLSRQRNQIVLLIFHASRDVGSRILRGVDTVMIKMPSRRQIEQGSKGSALKELLLEARIGIKQKEGDGRDWTYVDSEEPDYRGLLENPLPTFWTDDLSRVWRGIPMSFLKQGKRRNILDYFSEPAEHEVIPDPVFCENCKGFSYMLDGTCERCGVKYQGPQAAS